MKVSALESAVLVAVVEQDSNATVAKVAKRLKSKAGYVVATDTVRTTLQDLQRRGLVSSYAAALEPAYQLTAQGIAALESA